VDASRRRSSISCVVGLSCRRMPIPERSSSRTGSAPRSRLITVPGPSQARGGYHRGPGLYIPWVAAPGCQGVENAPDREDPRPPRGAVPGGRDDPWESFDLAAAQSYIKARLRETHGKRVKRPIRAYIARKELKSFRHAWLWCYKLKTVPVAPMWELAELRIPKDREPEPFRTMAETRTLLDRGGITPEEEKRLWDGLYLTGEELRRLLDHVRHQDLEGFVYPMFAFAIYTGARRSEMLRARLDDIDFRAGRVRLREKKRKKETGSTRSVKLHPALDATMKEWFTRHPGGQYALARDDGSALDVDVMDSRFEAAVRGTDWAVMKGFHVLRHSFASALAAAGVDQRIIDAFMGHQTEEMAKRYQHLRPDKLKDAILSLGV
jgi:integrase